MTIFILIIHFAIFRKNGLQTDAVIDINIHDTYFVITSSHFILMFSILIFFGVYSVRMVRRNFKNITANLIFMIANILMILLLFQTFKMIGSVVEVPTTLEDLTLSDGTKNGLKIFSNALFVIQILLLVLLSYIGFKTGVNYKQSAKKQ